MTDHSKNTKSRTLDWIHSSIKYLLIFLVIYTFINWWRQPVIPANPHLVLTDYQDQIIDIKSMSKDEPTLIYFWGSWCSVCTMTSSNINQLSKDGYSVVTIAIKSGSNKELGDYLKKKNLTFSVINDTKGKIFTNWQGQVTPSFVIIKDGKMIQGLSGFQPLWSLKLRLWISSFQ